MDSTVRKWVPIFIIAILYTIYRSLLLIRDVVHKK
jgi:hypothetical protein